MTRADTVDKLTPSMVHDLLPQMQKGRAMVYHVGSLMHDRRCGPKFQTIHDIALVVYQAYERGMVTLVQKKISERQTSEGVLREFNYLAIRK